MERRLVRMEAGDVVSTDILCIDADPAGVVVTLGEDQFGAPVTEYIDLLDLDNALRWMAVRGLDRAYFGRVGILTESDVVECRNAVLAAQARAEAQDEPYLDEAGRG